METLDNKSTESKKDTRFEDALREVISRHSQENQCNTADWILAKYLLNCLSAFSNAVNDRDGSYAERRISGMY